MLRLAFLTVGAVLLAGVGVSTAAEPVRVYVESNAADAARVLEVRHDPGAPARLVGTRPIYAAGTGAGLENQGAVATAGGGRRILAVAAGSGEVAVLAPGGRVLSRVPSEGTLPVSVDVRGDLVYVLNAGAPANIAGFRLRAGGQLRPLSGGRRLLSAPSSRAVQVGITPDRSAVVVVEREASLVTAFPLDKRGRPGEPRAIPSSGPRPFGFAFAGVGRVIVSETNATPGSVSSYRLTPGAALVPATRALSTGQASTCWAAVTPDGRRAYVTNTSANSISAYAIASDAALTPIGDSIPTGEGTAPTDVTTSPDGAFLYVVYARAGALGIFSIAGDGSLTAVQTLPLGSGTLTGVAATYRGPRGVTKSGDPRHTRYDRHRGGALSE